MLPPSKKARLLFFEATKVLAVFAALCLLQSQIFQMRYDIYGSTSGLAQAQEKTSSELGDTQRFVEQSLADSTLELARAKQALEGSVERLREERERLARFIDERARELDQRWKTRFEEEWKEVKAVKAAAEANAERLASLSSTLSKDPETMKRLMLFPTVQLRGNGTVGSGVLIYSQEQPGLGRQPAPFYTTFVITAYHVVVEVLGDRLERDIEEVHVMQGTHSDVTEVYSARLVLFDRGRDLALLRLNATRSFPHLADLMPAAAFQTLDIFAPAYAVGCPLGNRPLPTLGEISSKHKQVGDQVFWMLNAPTFFGNSGGGIYQAPSFKLIGVSSMIYTYGKAQPAVVPHMGLFVPLDAVYRWLDKEGYSFVHERRPIPRSLLWKLAWMEGGARPATAAAAEPLPSSPLSR
jgi:S1-C subfamily serine protease